MSCIQAANSMRARHAGSTGGRACCTWSATRREWARRFPVPAGAWAAACSGSNIRTIVGPPRQRREGKHSGVLILPRPGSFAVARGGPCHRTPSAYAAPVEDIKSRRTIRFRDRNVGVGAGLNASADLLPPRFATIGSPASRRDRHPPRIALAENGRARENRVIGRRGMPGHLHMAISPIMASLPTTCPRLFCARGNRRFRTDCASGLPYRRSGSRQVLEPSSTHVHDPCSADQCPTMRGQI